jgi:hypothetical protein
MLLQILGTIFIDGNIIAKCMGTGQIQIIVVDKLIYFVKRYKTWNFGCHISNILLLNYTFF